MITRKTTFVLGAGASVPYGLQTASDMMKRVRKFRIDRPVEGDTALAGRLSQLVPDAESILVQLRQFPSGSIDEFLNTRRADQRAQRLGRTLLVLLMVEMLAKAGEKVYKQPPDDWTAFLFERMRRGASTLEEFVSGNANAKFVTFNFDSVLEDRLKTFLKHSYGISGARAAEVVAGWPIVHVHGRLPPLEPEAPLNYIEQAAEQIHVVHDDLEAANETTVARTYVNEADTLCFLGFSYHPDNLLRLAIPQTFQRTHPPDAYGCAKGMCASDRHAALVFMGWDGASERHFGEENMGCFDFLRTFPVIG